MQATTTNSSENASGASPTASASPSASGASPTVSASPTASGASPTASGASPTASASPSASATTSSVPSGADLAPDLYALIVFLHKTGNADLFEAMGVLELTITQIKLLHQLEEAMHELTLKEAAERVPLSLAAASRTVDDLVRRGMVQRHEDAEDRRMKRVSLTDDGRSVIRRLNAARLNGLEQFATTLTEDERQALAGALAQLLRRPDIVVCRPERT